MQLRDYLADRGLTPADFAKKIGVHHDAVRKWLRGERMPRRKQLAAIKRTTSGKVTANDFQSDEMAA